MVVEVVIKRWWKGLQNRIQRHIGCIGLTFLMIIWKCTWCCCTVEEAFCLQPVRLLNHQRWSSENAHDGHSGEKPFACKQCNYSCTTASVLQRHMPTHTQVEAHKVILAASGPFFHAILKKNKHPHPLVFMRGVKLEGLVNLVCSESGTQTFVESETIESEIEERCTGEKPFVCTQCSYSSTTADNLKTHLRIHSGEKPFSCTQCEFSCTRVSYLKKHMLEHSGEKPFRCDQWNYSCARATMPLLRQAIWVSTEGDDVLICFNRMRLPPQHKVA